MRRKKTEGDTLTTACGRVYGKRLRHQEQLDGDVSVRCPTCRKPMERLERDGYSGSTWAHEGRGSRGLSPHHYFATCESCGDCSCELCSHEHSDECLDVGGYKSEDLDAPCDRCGETLGSDAEVVDDGVITCKVTGQKLGRWENRACECGGGSVVRL